MGRGTWRWVRWQWARTSTRQRICGQGNAAARSPEGAQVQEEHDEIEAQHVLGGGDRQGRGELHAAGGVTPLHSNPCLCCLCQVTLQPSACFYIERAEI